MNWPKVTLDKQTSIVKVFKTSERTLHHELSSPSMKN